MHTSLRWLDTVEQWILGLPYGPQVALVLIALLLIAIVVVRVLTVLIDRVGDRLHPLREPEAGTETAVHAADEGTR